MRSITSAFVSTDYISRCTVECSVCPAPRYAVRHNMVNYQEMLERFCTDIPDDIDFRNHAACDFALDRNWLEED